MGFQGYHFDVHVLLSDHAGERQERHEKLALALQAELNAVLKKVEYEEILVMTEICALDFNEESRFRVGHGTE